MNNILLHTVSIYLCTVPDDVYNLGMLLSPVLLYNIQYTIYVQYTIYIIHSSGRISYIVLGSILSGYAHHSVRCEPIYICRNRNFVDSDLDPNSKSAFDRFQTWTHFRPKLYFLLLL